MGTNKKLCCNDLLAPRYKLQPVMDSIYIAEGQNLKFGSVVDCKGFLCDSTHLEPYAIMYEDCDTTNGAQEANVLIMGEFNIEKLVFGADATGDVLDKIVFYAKKNGIIIRPYDYAPSFTPPEVSRIENVIPEGASQTNPLMNAEETQRMIDASIHEVTLDPSAVALGNVHLLDEVTSFAADAKILVDSETNGPGAMPAEDLLKLTAQNALAGNVAPAFDPTRTSENAYKAGESVAYNSKTYTFKVNHYGAWDAADVQQVPSGDTKLSKADALSETPTTIMDKHIGGIATNGTWFSSGQHTAVSVHPGDVFLITPKSTSATAGLYAFVTSDYVPGDHTSGAVPFCSGTSRQQIDRNTQKMAIAPADAAYLLLCTVDGAANKTFFDVLKKTERNKFAELFAGKAITKDYFIKNVDYLEFESYTGIVGTSTAWLNAGKHIAVPVNPGDTISVKPSRAANLTVVTPSYVPGNHTSGNVEFAIQNIGRQVVEPGAFTTIIAGVDAGYLILHIVDGGGNKVSWEIKKSIDVKLAESLVGMLSDGYKTLVSIDSLTTYKGALDGSGGWFYGTNLSHKALPVIPGEKYTISIPTNYSGNFAVVTSDYVPGDHTSGAVPFAGVSTNRTVVSGNTSIDITIPCNGAYLILTVHDGANMGVVYDVKKFTRTQKPLGTFQKLRYAHWNIGHFAMGKDDDPTITPEEKSEKQSAFRKFINSIHPDVLGVCEDDPYFATDETESSEAVYSCFEQQHPGLKAGYSMNSFYSNGLKILQFSWQSFPADTAGGRLFSEMLVDLDGDLVIMCETHLSWEDYEKRTNQIQYLVERYASAKYVIIAADWNIGEINGGPSEEEEMAPLVSAGYRMSMMDYMPKESTYAGNNVTPPSDSALDIICAKGFGLINAHVSQESAELSDHRLVYCDLIKNP